MNNPYRVEIDQDNGCIVIHRGSKEMLYWSHTEWEEDPELIFTIAEAINIAKSDPAEMDRRLAEMGKLNLSG